MQSVHICNEHHEDQKILTPETIRHKVRGASGRFGKAERMDERKAVSLNKLRKGYQQSRVKRKLEFKENPKENETLAKRVTRSLKISYFSFFHRNKNIASS